VLLGWALGAVIAAGFAFGVRYMLPLLSRASRSIKLLLIAAPVFILNAVNPGDTSRAALLLGFGGGYVFLSDMGGFDARKGSLVQKLIRLAVGAAGGAVIYFGLKYILPGEASPQSGLFRFLRYALCGIWAGFGAPWLFIRLGIAQAKEYAAAVGAEL
jgi:hypothetical protein